MASNIDWEKFREGYEEIFARLEGLEKEWEGIVPGGNEAAIAAILLDDPSLEKETKILRLDQRTDEVLDALRAWISIWLVRPAGLDPARERVMLGRLLYEQKRFGS